MFVFILKNSLSVLRGVKWEENVNSASYKTQWIKDCSIYLKIRIKKKRYSIVLIQYAKQNLLKAQRVAPGFWRVSGLLWMKRHRWSSEQGDHLKTVWKCCHMTDILYRMFLKKRPLFYTQLCICFTVIISFGKGHCIIQAHNKLPELQLVLSPPTSDSAAWRAQGGRPQLSKIWYPSFTPGSSIVLLLISSTANTAACIYCSGTSSKLRPQEKINKRNICQTVNWFYKATSTYSDLGVYDARIQIAGLSTLITVNSIVQSVTRCKVCSVASEWNYGL